MWIQHRKSLTIPDSLALAAAAVLLLLSQTGDEASVTKAEELRAIQSLAHCPMAIDTVSANSQQCPVKQQDSSAQGLVLASADTTQQRDGSGGGDSAAADAALFYLTTPSKPTRTGGN